MNTWKIWFEVFEDGEKIGGGVWLKSYKHKSSAVRRARQRWGNDLYSPITGTTISRKWIVSQSNPYI